MSDFKVDDVVAWSSQAGGQWARKRGVVVEVIEAGTKPQGLFTSNSSRKHTSYIVRVDRVGKKGKPKKPEYYWPVVSQLQAHPSPVSTEPPDGRKSVAKSLATKPKRRRVKKVKLVAKRKSRKARSVVRNITAKTPKVSANTKLGSDGGIGSPPDYQAVLDRVVTGVVHDTLKVS